MDEEADPFEVETVDVRGVSRVDRARRSGPVAERLAAFKVPVKVWITDIELPRNAAGKVLKRELRESVASQ